MKGKKCACHKSKPKPVKKGRAKRLSSKVTKIPKKNDTIQKYVKPDKKESMFY